MRSKSAFVLSIVVILVICAPRLSARVLQPLTIARLDYLNNVPMTGRFTFPETYKTTEADIWAVPSYAPVEVVTYPRNTLISVSITIYNPNPIPTSGQFVFNNSKYYHQGTVFNIDSYSTAIVVPADSSATVTGPIVGLPNFVAVGFIEANVDINPVTGMWLDAELSDTIILTEAVPTGLQTVPWLETLLDVCYWARGKSGLAAVSREVTFGLHWGFTFVYDGGPSHYFKTRLEIDQTDYLLKKLFDDRSSAPYWVNGDCRDVSGYLHLGLAAIGITSALEGEFASGVDAMYTNPICPIDSDGSTPPSYYASTIWNFHQVTLRSGEVYDACASQAYDLGGAVYANPPAGWSTASYWQTLNPSWIDPPGGPYRFWGLVDGYVTLVNETNPPTPEIFPSEFVSRFSIPIVIDTLSLEGE